MDDSTPMASFGSSLPERADSVSGPMWLALTGPMRHLSTEEEGRGAAYFAEHQRLCQAGYPLPTESKTGRFHY